MLVRYLTAALIGVALPGLAQQPFKPGWTTDPANGCRVWSDNVELTVAWSGKCPTGTAEGQGAVQWRFHDGKPAGSFEGELRDGKPNGRGMATYLDGNRYDGEWRDGKRSGRGLAIYANGNRYDGEWRDDDANGRGVAIYTSGARYEGEWRNHKPNGEGTYTHADGRVYSGTFINGCSRRGDLWVAVVRTARECGFE